MPKRPIVSEDLNKFIIASDPKISPNGEWILFGKKQLETDGKMRNQLMIVNTISKATKQLTHHTNSASQGVFSPNGEMIAFVRQDAKKISQISLLSMSVGEAEAISSLPEGSVSSLKWSPDNSKIAFLFRAQHSDFTHASTDARKESGEPTPPREIDTFWYRLDGDGYFMQQRYGLMVIDLVTHETSVVFDKCPMGSISFDWLHDSSGFALSHPRKLTTSRSPDEDMIEIVLLDGSRKELIADFKGAKGQVAVSPNGEFLAFVGTEFDTDPWSVKNKILWLVNLKTDSVECILPDDICLETSVNGDSKESGNAPILWSIDSKAIYFQIGQRGAVQIGFVQIDKPGAVKLTHGDQIISLGNRCDSGEKFACTWQNAECLPEIAVYDLNTHTDCPAKLTGLNDSLFSEFEVQPSREIEITDFKYPIHGWIIEPKKQSPQEKQPVIIEVHGGPHMMYGWTYMHEFQVLASQGYTVVFTNPRGSKGYGEEHCAAIRGSWGKADWEDIDNLTKWLIEQTTIDSSRIGIMGGSYGGYMTNWAIGHSKHYKAAITDRCVSNLVSMAGNSDFPFRPKGYWDAVAFSSLENIKLLWEASPIAYFDQVTTPTLVIHSEGDLRCNVEQSEQVFSALQMQNVPSKFIRYPSETSHGMSRNGPAKLRIHRLDAISDWWKKYL